MIKSLRSLPDKRPSTKDFLTKPHRLSLIFKNRNRLTFSLRTEGAYHLPELRPATLSSQQNFNGTHQFCQTENSFRSNWPVVEWWPVWSYINKHSLFDRTVYFSLALSSLCVRTANWILKINLKNGVVIIWSNYPTFNLKQEQESVTQCNFWLTITFSMNEFDF